MSYDHLPSHLKNCFAYCSLFPKDSELDKQNLIYFWIAQGYVKPRKDETLEMAGHAYFMELYRRSFFQVAEMHVFIGTYKMHDLVHDLAQHVAGEGSVILTEGMNQSHKKIRHVTIAYEIENSLPMFQFEFGRLRSSLFMCNFSWVSQVVDQQVRNFKFLRAVDMQRNSIKEVPCSIGELKYLRYLNLSDNKFSHLPDSITKLVNLITLDIGLCKYLVELPKDIGELISLRHLNNDGCRKLVQMPLSFGELTSLQHLGEFRVNKSSGVDGKHCGLDTLARFNLQGSLGIYYDGECNGGSKDDLMLECGQIPDTLEALGLNFFPNTRMPAWWREDPASRLPNLKTLVLRECEHVKHLPHLRCLPCLRFLALADLPELEYMEDEEIVSTTHFFPCLQQLDLLQLGELKGWSKRLNEDQSLVFPLLSELHITDCPLFVSMPLAPHLKSLELDTEQVVATCTTSSRPSTSSTPSSSLQEIQIDRCIGLTSFPGEGLTSLRKLQISKCPDLRNLELAPSFLEEFIVYRCPKLDLWDQREEEEWCSVDWASFPNLRLLGDDDIPEEGRLPDSLQQLISLGQLQIR